MITPKRQPMPTLIRLLGSTLLNGAAAGVVTGAILIATPGFTADLLSMQVDSGLSSALYLQICAQIGACAALFIGLFSESRR